MRRTNFGRGFTVIELIAVVLVIMLIIGIMLPAIGRPSGGTRHLKDATQVRAVVQSMTVWANNNKGKYPLPSETDALNATTAETGPEKDHTANILSLLIFNGSIAPEMCVSPAEASAGGVQGDGDYEYHAPKAAVSPANALWDPAFRADFTDPSKPGNVSYAHVAPSGEPLKQWADTFSATEAVFGNRGPLVNGATSSGKGRVTTAHDTNSVTMLIHGGRTSWEGNIGYNDGHVAFETAMAPAGLTYDAGAGAKKPDVLFFDEPDDVAALNAYLGVYTKGGATPQEFKRIWD